MFNHFLITRFNLRKPDWNEDKNSQQVLGESWLKNRINLFKNYCLPSVLGQTNKNFRWLIFFEKDSEPEIKFLLEQLDSHSFIEPILVNGYQEFQTGIPQFIAERLTGNPEWIVTTRLDNDDALNKFFIEKIQNSIDKPRHNLVLHFPCGLFLDLANRNKLASAQHPLNQFVSLLESLKEKELKTVLSKEHDQWDENFHIQAVTLKDAWLQISHSQNLVNEFRGFPAYTSRLKNFTFERLKFSFFYDLSIFFSVNLKKILKYVK